MWFLHDGTGWTLCCLAHGELAWLFLEPDTRLFNCPRILLSCFRVRTSDQDGERDLGARLKGSRKFEGKKLEIGLELGTQTWKFRVAQDPNAITVGISWVTVECWQVWVKVKDQRSEDLKGFLFWHIFSSTNIVEIRLALYISFRARYRRPS